MMQMVQVSSSLESVTPEEASKEEGVWGFLNSDASRLAHHIFALQYKIERQSIITVSNSSKKDANIGHCEPARIWSGETKKQLSVKLIYIKIVQWFDSKLIFNRIRPYV